ncbi:unnamed protein product [Fusarium fujikuroi]|uniref:Uncharacterized protein n=1 Tax=Fusarium fujikuroi TaxID=5127 RepID=A0A9Q9UDZ2_FUSFU|nr:unnamed protein product [Fusarium fujikuroi]VTT76996.1 unnamed protein product [Fusarium fujikuroi]VZH89713.1 unnamed protein product [Fusarium fujikuroi]
MSAEALDSLDLLKKGKKTLLNLVAVAKCRIHESDFLPGVDHRWRSRGGIQIGAKDFKNSITHMLEKMLAVTGQSDAALTDQLAKCAR